MFAFCSNQRRNVHVQCVILVNMVNVSAKYVATRWLQHRQGVLLRFVTSWARNLFSFSEYVNEIIDKFLAFSLVGLIPLEFLLSAGVFRE